MVFMKYSPLFFCQQHSLLRQPRDQSFLRVSYPPKNPFCSQLFQYLVANRGLSNEHRAYPGFLAVLVMHVVIDWQHTHA